MTFNIASQSGGVINNVAGNQQITGGQHGSLVATAEARHALQTLPGALAAAVADPATATQAHALMVTMDAAIGRARPDRSRFADALERLVRLLASAGTLATAGNVLIGPLQTLAAWLGDIAQPVLHLLAALG
jgi:hypothetical protein